MLNIPVPQVVLDQPGIRPPVGQRIATGMAQHVRVRLHQELRLLAVAAQHHPHRAPVDRRSAIRHKERVATWRHPGSNRQPGL